MTYLAVMVGGARPSPKRKPNPNHSETYRLKLSGKALREFLRIVGPYLIAKRDAAQLMCKWSHLKGIRGSAKISEEEYRLECRMFKELRDLNRKGCGKRKIPDDIRGLF